MLRKYTPYIFYFVLFWAIMAAAVTFNSIDNDLFSRLLMGKHVLLTGQPMFHDVISYTKTNIWYDHEWLSSGFFYLISQWFGLKGLIVLKGLTFYLTFVFMTLLFKEIYPKQSPYNIVFFLLCLYTVIDIKPMGSLIRCQQLTFMLLPLWIFILEKIRRGNDKYLYIVPPMMLLWFNIHGAALAALAIVFFYGLGEALNKKPFTKYFIVFAISCLMLFINPWGPDYIKFMVDACFVDRGWIGEWQPPFNYSFQFLTMYKILVILTPILTVIDIWKKDFKYQNLDKVKYIVLYAFWFISIAHIKHTWPFCIMFFIFFYEDIYDSYNYIMQKIKEKLKITDSLAQMLTSLRQLIIYSVMLVVSIVILATTSMYVTAFKDFNESFPMDALEFIRLNNIKGKVLATYFHSGFVGYKGYPDLKIFMDGREEQLYPNNYIDLSMKFFNWDSDDPNPSEIIDKYRPEIIISDDSFKAGHQIEDLDKLGFAKIYGDENFSVFVDKKMLKKSYYYPLPSTSVYFDTICNTKVMEQEQKQVRWLP